MAIRIQVNVPIVVAWRVVSIEPVLIFVPPADQIDNTIYYDKAIIISVKKYEVSGSTTMRTFMKIHETHFGNNKFYTRVKRIWRCS